MGHWAALLASPQSKGRWDRCMKSFWGWYARDRSYTSVWRELGPAQYKPFFISETCQARPGSVCQYVQNEALLEGHP